jgi:hypothetical protein
MSAWCRKRAWVEDSLRLDAVECIVVTPILQRGLFVAEVTIALQRIAVAGGNKLVVRGGRS